MPPADSIARPLRNETRYDTEDRICYLQRTSLRERFSPFVWRCIHESNPVCPSDSTSFFSGDFPSTPFDPQEERIESDGPSSLQRHDVIASAEAAFLLFDGHTDR